MLETTARPHASVEEWLRLIRGEYLEIPGLNLTQRQFERLWGFDTPTSGRLLEMLLASGFLRRARNGGYVRSDGIQ